MLVTSETCGALSSRVPTWSRHCHRAVEPSMTKGAADTEERAGGRSRGRRVTRDTVIYVATALSGLVLSAEFVEGKGNLSQVVSGALAIKLLSIAPAWPRGAKAVDTNSRA